MITFILIILVASVIGVQMGIFSVLKQKNISNLRSVIYSFGIYIMPFLIIIAHIHLYKNRYLLIQNLGRKRNMSQEELIRFGETLNSFQFLIGSIWIGLKDIFTLKDNLIVLVQMAKIYDKKYSSKNTKTLLERIGIIGVLKKIIALMRDALVSHATNQVFISKHKAKHS
ncbi:hypothetical protein [Virgibacillus sp. Bac332]|uniref:hypothetical protein n=1 Tax=Virgibacillus sp. Bac332 TaxID=2419842 RepID=UPI0003FA25E6|nr:MULTISPECIES: hypothetical protein [Bacillaceae]